jgi:lysophospholipase L1-like esterase
MDRERALAQIAREALPAGASNLVFATEAELPTLGQCRNRKAAALRAACQQEIHAGFSSAALGTLHTYPAGETDQRNLAAAVMASLLPGQADRPIPRTDKNSEIAHQQLLAKAKQGRIDIYFEGDSITRRWGATDYPQLLENWNKNFFGWNAADFGWGADLIENILWRLENGELDGVNPKVIVLLAGTNDIGNTPATDAGAAVANVTKGLEAIVRLMQSKAPDAAIILMGIFPRNDGGNVIDEIDKINLNLSKMADGRRVRYLNINDKLADHDGNLYDGMMNADNLHPAVNGYQVWADALKPLFTELLGPPAKEDHAPAPTGDPSSPPQRIQ